MSDMTIITKMLIIIRETETDSAFNPALLDAGNLSTTEGNRDRLAVQLQNAGLIYGLATSEDIDNASMLKVFWQNSRPRLTLEGTEYMESNSSFKRCVEALKTAGKAAAGAAAEAILMRYMQG